MRTLWRPVALVLVYLVTMSRAFILFLTNNRAPVSITASESDQNEPSDRQQRREALFEGLAAQGAARIAAMDVDERTKRAMLAEAVEDRIYQMQDDLEQLVPDPTRLPTGRLREQCVELAQSIRHAQSQYQELVSGGVSDMLQQLEGLGNIESDR